MEGKTMSEILLESPSINTLIASINDSFEAKTAADQRLQVDHEELFRRLDAGETTGDPIKDIVVRLCIPKEHPALESNLRELATLLMRYPGELFFIQSGGKFFTNQLGVSNAKEQFPLAWRDYLCWIGSLCLDKPSYSPRSLGMGSTTSKAGKNPIGPFRNYSLSMTRIYAGNVAVAKAYERLCPLRDLHSPKPKRIDWVQIKLLLSFLREHSLSFGQDDPIMRLIESRRSALREELEQPHHTRNAIWQFLSLATKLEMEGDEVVMKTTERLMQEHQSTD
jgi:hypothetical protein